MLCQLSRTAPSLLKGIKPAPSQLVLNQSSHVSKVLFSTIGKSKEKKKVKTDPNAHQSLGMSVRLPGGIPDFVEKVS